MASGRRAALASLTLLALATCGLRERLGDEIRKIDDWSRTVDGTGERWGRDVATSKDGGLVALVGAFDMEAVFGAGSASEVTLASTGGWNSYVAAYEVDGTFAWARSIAGQDAFVQAVAMDPGGRIAVAGYTSTTAIFDLPDGSAQAVTPPAGALVAGFAAVFERDGRLAWVRPLLGDQVVEALDVDMRGDGRVVVGGLFSGTANLGAVPAISSTTDGFLLEYSPTGTLISEFETASVSPGYATIWSVACFEFEPILIAGDFQGVVNVGTHTLVSLAGSQDVFLASMDPVGGVGWTNRVGGPGRETLFAVDVSERNEVVITGTFEESAEVGASSPAPVTLSSHGLQDAFLAKLDEFGVLQWAKSIGGAGTDSAYAVAISKDGKVVVTGAFDLDLDMGEGVEGPVLFAPTADGQSDLYLGYYRADGVIYSAFRSQEAGAEFGMGVAVDKYDSVVASGAITSPITITGLPTEITHIPVTGDRGAYLVYFAP
jgi:hypothetical protein